MEFLIVLAATLAIAYAHKRATETITDIHIKLQRDAGNCVVCFNKNCTCKLRRIEE